MCDATNNDLIWLWANLIYYVVYNSKHCNNRLITSSFFEEIVLSNNMLCFFREIFSPDIDVVAQKTWLLNNYISLYIEAIIGDNNSHCFKVIFPCKNM